MTNVEDSLLLTDLYQLTMLDAYRQSGMTEPAVFELFVRRMPACRRFLVAAGLDQALAYLEGARFTPDELAWLAGTGQFSSAFVDSLADFRFTGDVDAMPEGTVFFPDEPVLRVTAPVAEAQLVESRIINLVNMQSMVASKAARCVTAARGRRLVDFGMRRAHGAEAALAAARAAWIAGFDGTATVLAGRRFGIPTFGTMAHSFVQAHLNERQAFLDFARARPEGVVLLIDTYDVEAAVGGLGDIAATLEQDGIRIVAVRLDSGDLLAGTRRIRQLLDAQGLDEVGIFLSGNLDEYTIEGLMRDDAPADGFGVGTHLDTSADAPSLDFVYKLQQYADRPVRKRSRGKETWPGPKQVWRRFGDDGRFAGDVITPMGETHDGEALLVPVMRDGRRLEGAGDLEGARRRAAESLAAIPDDLRGLHGPGEYPVERSASLEALAEAADAAII